MCWLCCTSLSRTERKKPYEDEIKLCNVLLAYLTKHESQSTSTDSSSTDNKEIGATNEFRGTEGKTLFGLRAHYIDQIVVYEGEAISILLWIFRYFSMNQ